MALVESFSRFSLKSEGKLLFLYLVFELLLQRDLRKITAFGFTEVNLGVPWCGSCRG